MFAFLARLIPTIANLAGKAIPLIKNFFTGGATNIGGQILNAAKRVGEIASGVGTAIEVAKNIPGIGEKIQQSELAQQISGGAQKVQDFSKQLGSQSEKIGQVAESLGLKPLSVV